MKIVIASDSFKGSLSSEEVSSAAEEGIREVFPSCEVLRLKVADGGEGLVEALSGPLHCRTVSAEVCDPLGRRITARYAVSDGTAVLEMASASGLPLLSLSERNPLKTSTYGTGQMILDAFDRGCRRFIVGIGGSATNDGGTGMLSALGWRFIDEEGCVLQGRGEYLEKIADIDDSRVDARLNEAEFTVACDVRNPFVGRMGASRIFAPQKGADENSVGLLEKGMCNFASVIREKYGSDLSNVEGAGAAGGMGGAFLVFLNASLRPGVDMVLDAVGFDQAADGSDLIITGEGKLDSQTLQGKVVSGVLARGLRMGIPVAAIAGKVESEPVLGKSGLTRIVQVTPADMPMETAMKPDVAKNNVKRAVRHLVSNWTWDTVH